MADMKVVINSEDGCKPCEALKGFLPTLAQLYPGVEFKVIEKQVESVKSYPRTTIYDGEQWVLSFVGYRGGAWYVGMLNQVLGR